MKVTETQLELDFENIEYSFMIHVTKTEEGNYERGLKNYRNKGLQHHQVTLSGLNIFASFKFLVFFPGLAGNMDTNDSSLLSS